MTFATVERFACHPSAILIAAVLITAGHPSAARAACADGRPVAASGAGSTAAPATPDRGVRSAVRAETGDTTCATPPDVARKSSAASAPALAQYLPGSPPAAAPTTAPARQVVDAFRTMLALARPKG